MNFEKLSKIYQAKTENITFPAYEYSISEKLDRFIKVNGLSLLSPMSTIEKTIKIIIRDPKFTLC